MNPDYILREQGAVLNWFDITEREGYFSLNDTLGDITKTLRGKLWLAQLSIAMAQKENKQKNPASSNKKSYFNRDIMKMLGSFTVLRFTGMLGMRNISFTKEELLEMNRELNKIRKPNP